MRCKPGGSWEVRCNGGDCGRLVAAPTFVDGHGGRPERDVEGAVPYEGERTRRIVAGANPADGGGGNVKKRVGRKPTLKVAY